MIVVCLGFTATVSQEDWSQPGQEGSRSDQDQEDWSQESPGRVSHVLQQVGQ